jgi:hypothetical protein
MNTHHGSLLVLHTIEDWLLLMSLMSTEKSKGLLEKELMVSVARDCHKSRYVFTQLGTLTSNQLPYLTFESHLNNCMSTGVKLMQQKFCMRVYRYAN